MKYQTIALGFVASLLAVRAPGQIPAPSPPINLAQTSRPPLLQAAAKVVGKQPWRIYQTSGWVGYRVGSTVDFMPDRSTARAITYDSIHCASEDASLAQWSCNPQSIQHFADISPSLAASGCRVALERVSVDPALPMNEVVQILDHLAENAVQRELPDNQPTLVAASCGITSIHKQNGLISIQWGEVGCGFRSTDGHPLILIGCGLSVP